MKPATLLIPVPDVEAGLAWYKRAFPAARVVYVAEFDFTVLEIGDFSLDIVQADKKVNSGQQGTVLYWSVPSLYAAIQHFQTLGASLYRGPIKIDNGLGMCQVKDPFGNLIGLKGRFKDEEWRYKSPF
ncbi:Var1 [Xenorhabdus doucetiae]|uniref:Enzyme related to lactoylglutathione lyase n=2 Tax=Xenorhabdus doucetiae TaxID=351671 RepID=A0A068QT95_9GAMM|nr:putative enzyme related to lactoylglutathione lyase [Xenorhabdus doucetiae]CDG17070.1 Var1 [Xenorhabdus doucetiae]